MRGSSLGWFFATIVTACLGSEEPQHRVTIGIVQNGDEFKTSQDLIAFSLEAQRYGGEEGKLR